MASMLAIVSQLAFRRDAKGVGSGQVWNVATYASTRKQLDQLAGTGDLYLVTVRGGALWLVAILRKPAKTATGWTAAPNTEPAREIQDLRREWGLPLDDAKLGMALQTPRLLTAVQLEQLDPAAEPAAKPVPQKPAPPVVRVKAPPARNHLSYLRAAIEEGRHAAALQSLIGGLWLDHPSAELAQLITKISDQARVPFAGDWDTAVQAADHTTKPALLDAVTAVTASGAKVRLARVATWMPDPRVEELFVRILEQPPFTTAPSRPFWTELFACAQRISNPALVPRLEAALPPLVGSVSEALAPWLRTKLSDLLVELRPIVALPRELSPAIRELVSDYNVRPRAAADLEALLAAVYADPTSDIARAIYADALTELGDPRGELITAQLRLVEEPDNAGLREHVRALVATHGPQWLGKLRPWLHAHYTFERGFLATAELYAKRNIAEAAGLAEWSTVHTFAGAAVIALDPVMKSLRTVEVDDTWTEAELAQLAAKKIEIVR